MNRDCGHSTGNDQETADTVQGMIKRLQTVQGMIKRLQTVQEMTRDCRQYRG
ncbi:unnamed protein product [Staurois parvus]|uniref:Uncharacterized protein n=1 Tax=Staurois parvus TaxID=386267 RepID=A0ABN9B8D1_9NEOB|nr:unnamed protein product [Staurois parvus]